LAARPTLERDAEASSGTLIDSYRVAMVSFPVERDCDVAGRPSMQRFEAKRAVIIGGTSGMGLATAKMLLDGGARVLATGRSEAGVESAHKELGNGAVVVSSDARSLAEIDVLASRVKAEFDTFDLLFVNAGFSLRAPLENTTEAIYDEMFNLNAKGPFFAVQKLAPLINRGGAVVLTTSVSNVKGTPGSAAYGAAKAALRSFARTLATELLPREIRVNAVTPGPIDTPIFRKAAPSGDIAARVTKQLGDINPMKRLGRPEEIAKAVLFLAFDATFTTGAELPVDGGWSQL
jgi:NAD(P)-dependent dehydrogenase (short-subunit alcohol dehydrogenase family)